ncbi:MULTISPECIES: hypothetical protein [Hymenobacter]|uniref:Uncharacterized protein n=1 Tax=Hymenobacter armeniacus TaxID=2771358 RepID=A0ABR8JUC9_9BACT|nr:MULTISPECIES: hypothetical protein [Hymenobacter]MBD2723562.1 hypothetical protein [Hymenobacter armeniacus]MBJ6107571.1 hypothetical protein [Hymenobacter sp. BT523]
MRPELERLQLIEQHLLNGPAALPAGDWNLRLLLDGELAADTATQQRLYQGLRRAGRQQLRQELRSIHARLYRGRWAWLRRLWSM